MQPVGVDAVAIMLGHDRAVAHDDERVGVALLEPLAQCGQRSQPAEPDHLASGCLGGPMRDRRRRHELRDVGEGPAVVRGVLPGREGRLVSRATWYAGRVGAAGDELGQQ